MGDQSVLRNKTPIPRLLLNRGRFFSSLLAALLAALVTMKLPTETRILVSFDLAALTYVGLFVALMSVSTPEQSADLARQGELSGARVLVGAVVLSLVSVSVVAALVNNLADAARWLRVTHIIISVAALGLTWLLAHIFFGLQYMKIYYDDNPNSGGGARELSLDYPNRPKPDFWDFMYYSFTIAMCFQTSDVTVASPLMRRLTLMHAIFSFFFVMTIIGFVVNVLSNAL